MVYTLSRCCKESAEEKPGVRDPLIFFLISSSKSDFEGIAVCRRQIDSGSRDSYFKYDSEKGLF